MKTTCKHPVLKIIFLVWLILATIYVLIGEYNRLTNFVYKKGVADTVIEVMTQAQACKAFDVTYRDKGVQLINVACLQQPQKDANVQPDSNVAN